MKNPLCYSISLIHEIILTFDFFLLSIQKQEAENKTEKEDKEKDLCLPQDGADKNNVPNSAEQTSSVQGGAVSSEPPKKQPSDVGNKATPPPVAPPRKKRQQKKEALAKSQVSNQCHYFLFLEYFFIFKNSSYT